MINSLSNIKSESKILKSSVLIYELEDAKAFSLTVAIDGCFSIRDANYNDVYYSNRSAIEM